MYKVIFTFGLVSLIISAGLFVSDAKVMFEREVWQPLSIGDALDTSDAGFGVHEWLSDHDRLRFLLALPASYATAAIGFASCLVGALCARRA